MCPSSPSQHWRQIPQSDLQWPGRSPDPALAEASTPFQLLPQNQTLLPPAKDPKPLG